MNIIREIARCRGGYVLIVEVKEPVKFECGNLGLLRLNKGVYLYIGSSVGSGGVRSRLARHFTESKKLKWHIDWLLSLKETRIIGVFWVCKFRGVEETLYTTLLNCNFKIAGSKFGSTDTKHLSHLFYSGLGSVETIGKVVVCMLRSNIEFTGYLIDSL